MNFAQWPLPNRSFVLEPCAGNQGKNSSIAAPLRNTSSWTSWEDVFSDMATSPTCSLGQAWRTGNDDHFLPTCVSIAHDSSNIVIYGELQDLYPFNPERTFNSEAFKYGDVFEVFLRPGGALSYIEIHVTPENFQLQMHFPNSEAIRTNRDLDKFKIAKSIPSTTAISTSPSGWRVLLFLSLSELFGISSSQSNPEFDYSFCRYDYLKNSTKPILSSTSSHRIVNFHNIEDWGRLKLIH